MQFSETSLQDNMKHHLRPVLYFLNVMYFQVKWEN